MRIWESEAKKLHHLRGTKKAKKKNKPSTDLLACADDGTIRITLGGQKAMWRSQKQQPRGKVGKVGESGVVGLSTIKEDI